MSDVMTLAEFKFILEKLRKDEFDVGRNDVKWGVLPYFVICFYIMSLFICENGVKNIYLIINIVTMTIIIICYLYLTYLSLPSR